MKLDELIRAGLEAGFSRVAPLDAETLHLKPEVRQMCASDSCGKYNTNWSCPPGCGTLEECQARIARYSGGILVQTIGDLEDSFDGEGMLAAEARHKETFSRFYARLRAEYPQMLAIGAGCCTQCASCAYPDQPCRLPDRMTSSMESYGMLVLEVCRDNHLEYYYGPKKIAYTSCYLLELKDSAVSEENSAREGSARAF